MSKEPQENCNPIRNTSTVPHTLHLMRTDPGFISLLLIKTCFCVATITMRDEDWLDPMFFFELWLDPMFLNSRCILFSSLKDS